MAGWHDFADPRRVDWNLTVTGREVAAVCVNKVGLMDGSFPNSVDAGAIMANRSITGSKDSASMAQFGPTVRQGWSKDPNCRDPISEWQTLYTT